MNLKLSEEETLDAMQRILLDSECGNVHRIKGFLCGREGWLELNAAAGQTRLNPIKQGQEILIVIGEKLNKKKIEQYFYRIV